MNKLNVFFVPAVAALSLAAIAAHAEGPDNYDVAVSAPVSAKTRAEVQGEVLQARARGEITNGGTNFDPLAFVPRTAQPRTVLAQQPRSRRADDLARAMGSQDSGSVRLSQHPATPDASHALAGK